jgi:multicomponent Na+:H+ antiporter subunit A
VVFVGVFTLLLGAALGLFQTDLKRILAYTTLAVLGMLTMLIGFGSDLALKSMLVFMLGHALYKAALFMVAGGVDHGTGTRDVWKLGGLHRLMPFTMVAGALAAFSKAGFPPFLGFIGKEYVYETGTSLDRFAPFFTGAMLVGNMLIFALALKVGWYPFWSKRGEAAESGHAHEGSWMLWLPPLVLAVLGLVFGFIPGWTGDTLVLPAMAVITGKEPHAHLALWHGITLPLILSLVTFAGGLFFYHAREFFWRRQSRLEAAPKVENAYFRLLYGMVDTAKRTTRTVQGGSLSRYLFVVVGATATLLLWKFARFSGWPELTLEGDFMPIPVLACMWSMGGAIVAAKARHRLTALLAMGLVGLGMTVLFVNYGAPDLAITQLLVDGLTVVLLLLVVYRLPPIRPETNRWVLRADTALALLIGGLVAALTLSAMQLHVIERVGDVLAQMSYPEAHGRNVVNVILVDFRALDTFGEIIVLAIAAIGVTALLTARKTKEDAE